MRDVTGGANWTDGSQLQESMGQSGSAFSADFFSFVRQNVIDAGGQSSIELDAETLLQGAYGRDGDDLLITAPDGSTTTIIDYFDADAPAALVSADGAMLLGHTVELLAGPASPGQYAQAAAVPANPIGSISLLTGTASVQHADGTTEPLVIGSSVFEDDVIATGDGSKMSIKFIDGTALSMSANARMVMDELVYDPSATDNSMVLNLVQGSFVFVTGLVAKTGSVSATTPVATMGIRGTTPAVTIDSVTNSTTFGIVPDPDGTIGSYQIINLVTGQVLGTVSSPQFVYQLASATGQLEQLLLTAAEIGDIGLLLQDTYNTFGLPGDQQDNQDGNDGGNDQQNQDGQQGGELQDDPRLENFTSQFALLEALSELVTGEDNEFEITQLFTQQDLNTFIDTQDDEPPPTDDTGQPAVFSFAGSVTLDEDSGATLSGFSISYPGELTVAIAAGSTLTLNSTEGLTFTVGDGTNDQVMVFTGSAEAIMRALNGATYTPTEDANHGSLQMVFVDSATGKIVGAINVPITITPQPDPPIANNDVFFDIPEDAGRDGNAVFKANLFDDNGFGPDYDPDPGETPVVTQFWVDWNGDGTYDAHVVLENGVGTFQSAGGRVTVHEDGSIEIVPGPTYDYLSAGESKQVGLKYEIESNGDTAQAIVTGFITGQNDAPVVQDIATAVNENGAAKTLTASFTDVDVNDSHTVTVNTTGTVGKVVNNGDGTFSYDPNGKFEHLGAGETATDTFTYTVNDGHGGVVTKTATVTVNGQNDAPVVQNIATAVNENGPAKTLTASFTDVDVNDSHTVTVNTTGTVGKVVNNGDGTFSYDPNGKFEHLGAGETATDTFTYTVNDGHGGVVTKTVTVTVNGQNDAPVVHNVAATANEDGPAIQISANFTDVDVNDTHTITINTANTLGTVVNNGDGTFTYNPNGQFEQLNDGETATDTFTYTVNDGHGGVVTKTVTVTINGSDDEVIGNQAPVANNDLSLEPIQVANSSFNQTPDFTGWTIDTSVTAGGQNNSIESVTFSTATIVRTAFGAPEGDNTVAVLSFEGWITNGGQTAFGPTITSDPFSAQAGDEISFIWQLESGGDFALGYGYIRDAQTHEIVQTIFEFDDPNEAFDGSTGFQTTELVLETSGNFYMEFQVGSFDWTGGRLVGSTLTLDFAGVTSTLTEDNSATFLASELLANDTDPDGDTLSIIAVSNAASGAEVTIDQNGNIVYTANDAFDYLSDGETATDAFTYTISDGKGGTSTATATVTIRGKEDQGDTEFDFGPVNLAGENVPVIAVRGHAEVDETFNAIPDTVLNIMRFGFNGQEDSLDVSAVLDVALTEANKNQLISIELNEVQGEANGYNVFVDADGPGGADPVHVASLAFHDGPPSADVLNVVFNNTTVQVSLPDAGQNIG